MAANDIATKLEELTTTYQAQVAKVIKGGLQEFKKQLETVAKTYAGLQDSTNTIDVWGDEEIKALLQGMGLAAGTTKKSKKGGKGGKRLTGEKKENIKTIIAKIVNASGKKGIKRGDIQAHNDIVTYCNSVGFSKVPNLAGVLKEMLPKLIKKEGEKATTVYKPA